MADRPGPSDASRAQAAAAYAAACGELATSIDVALEIERLAYALDEVRAAVIYRGRISCTRRVKAELDLGRPGKCEITYARADGELETIETDWLSRPTATLIALRAQAGVGRMATFYKNNDDDPSNKRASGFRRLVWLVVDLDESEAPVWLQR